MPIWGETTLVITVHRQMIRALCHWSLVTLVCSPFSSHRLLPFTPPETPIKTIPGANISGWVRYKLSDRNIYGGRPWIRAFGVLTQGVLLLYGDKSMKVSNSESVLPPSITLTDKQVVSEISSKHLFTLALASAITNQIVAWLRFQTLEHKEMWIRGTSPSKISRHFPFVTLFFWFTRARRSNRPDEA